jgi:xanthine dehydrogenase small subunit
MPPTILLDGVLHPLHGPPSTTLLDWLRAQGHRATKEGCAEGDCGACTVAVLEPSTRSYRVMNACLVLLPQVAGREVWTAAGIGRPGALHPAQEAMVQVGGSQCGFCTPGFVMSLFEATYRADLREAWQWDDQLAGNLCRCTGYRPIQDALRAVGGQEPDDRFSQRLRQPIHGLPAVHWETDGSYIAPTRLDELLDLRARHPDARIVAGATDLGLDVTQRHLRPGRLLGVERVGELQDIHWQGDWVEIGSAVRLAVLEDATADRLPAVHRMLRYFGARAIKQQGTVGGNLCTASPIGDLAPVLLAHAATALIGSVRGRREVPLASFFTGYRTIDLAADELLLGVRVPLPGAEVRTGAWKVSRRRELDISAVSLGGWLRVVEGRVVEARLAYGGMGPRPARATLTEQALLGETWGPEAAMRAGRALSADWRPMDDHRASAAFRMTLARNLLVGFALETKDTRFVTLPARPVGTVVPPEGAR